ncbi:MAG: hypothetical protein PHH09_04640 [Methanoregulaceae archaeon]|nr:hypothetical protein [Methanoregulaceae archaeon]
MMHDSGLGLVRCDWDNDAFQSYHGDGSWADDEEGFDLWMGISSDYMHYTKIDESQAVEVMEKIDHYIKSKAPLTSPPQN